MLKITKNYFRARIKKILLEEIWLKDLISMGMKIGDNCSIQPGVIFDYSHCWLIRIGDNVTIAPEAYLLAHDASTKMLNGYTKISSISIEDNVFIGARALIMPGVTIGKNTIVAAGSIVTKSIPENSVVAGNPARIISTLEEYKVKINKQFNDSMSNVYDNNYTLKGNVSDNDKNEMYEQLKSKIGFVK
ncbi:acyltransferase [Priestia aryabhattai]|uniref:acyltransferase n=1 Tax=Priestia aryabhattai TaxID=412384 RepID=UPI003D29A919